MWWVRAACRGRDPDLWYADTNTGLYAAKRVCAGCPVQVECLAEAMALEGDSLDIRSRHGVWGGTSPALRLRLARRAKEGAA